MRALPLVLLALAACDGTDGSVICTEIGCQSSLEVRLGHTLDLTAGPTEVIVSTPLESYRCVLAAAATGSETCTNGAGAQWSAGRITVKVVGSPFFDLASNPEGEPFEAVTASVTANGEPLDPVVIDLDPGDPQQPNGPDCEPTCFAALGVAEIGG